MAHYTFTAANAETHLVSGSGNRWFVFNWPIVNGKAVSGPHKSRKAAIQEFNQTLKNGS